MARTRRLQRSRNDKMISGVAGGMAEYFDVDPVFVRLGWFASVFLTGGFSILVYIVMIIVVPKMNYTPAASPDATPDDGASVGEYAVESDETIRRRRERRRYLLGIVVILVGIAFLLHNLNILGLGSVEWGVLGAVAIIATGAALLLASILNNR